MSRQTLRTFLAALAAAAVSTLATPAWPAFYNPGFDPEFDGTALFQISDACLALSNGLYFVFAHPECQVDMLSADLFDTNNTSIHYTGSQSNIAFDVVIAGNELISFDTGDPFLSCGVECSGDVEFFTANTFCFDETCEPLATLTTFDQTLLRDGYRLIRVTQPAPEPGTLGLLGGGIAAAWLSRRRKNKQS